MEPTQTSQTNPNEFTVLGQGTIKDAHVEGPLDKFKKIGLFLIILILSFYSCSFLLAKFNHKAPSDEAPLKPLAKPKESEAPLVLKTYTDGKNLFSIQHQVVVTEGRSADDPFPVALQLRYNDPVTEFKIGEEKPGWFLRISQRLDHANNKSAVEFAKENKLVNGEDVSSVTLADRPAIKWRSAVYPQTFYLIDTGDAFFFIKTQINSQFMGKHQVSIDAVLATLKLLEKPVDPDLGLKWVRRQFGDSWNFEVPENWQVKDEGAKSGFISLVGEYSGNFYQADFSYPVFEDHPNPGIPTSLGAWLQQDLNSLTPEQKNLVISSDLKIGETVAKIILNYPQPGSGNLSHRLYIWKRSDRNPSQVVIYQNSGELDGQKMRTLFERFVKGIK